MKLSRQGLLEVVLALCLSTVLVIAVVKLALDEFAR